jgi:SAM-dependent methyltransferase
VKQFKDHFSERAAGYASYRPHYPAALAGWLASVAPARHQAWDAACGSGQLSTLLGDRFDRVIATDASAAQIAQADEHPRVEYRTEPAERTSIPDGSTDLVTVAQAAHWLDLAAFHEEARRVARREGVVAFVAYGRTMIEPAIDAIVERFYSGPLAPYWPPERRHIETGYRDLAFPFEKIVAPALDMQLRWTADQLIGYIGTWSAVRAMEKAIGGAATEQFNADLRRRWGDGVRDVRWPLVILAGRVT